MNELYHISHDYLEIISGTDNTTARAYREAAENIEKNTATGYGYLKNFIKSIDTLSKKSSTQDDRISNSKGNIRNFDAYDSINFAVDFLSKNLSSLTMVKECKQLKTKLEDYATLYSRAYDKKVRLAILEYETALYLLVTALSMIMASNVDVVSNGTTMKIQKKSAQNLGIITRTLSDYTKQLSASDHKQYLEAMIKASEVDAPESYDEAVMYENAVDDIMAAIDVIWTGGAKLLHFGGNVIRSIKHSIFGIVPLIRSCIYLHYKKKADTINNLEQQCQFIKMNIDQLNNIKTIDPEKKKEMIKKQEAVIEQYQKKAEKLRAQLVETEKDTATAIKSDDTKIKETSGKDDDFVLEFGETPEEVFDESEDDESE